MMEEEEEFCSLLLSLFFMDASLKIFLEEKDRGIKAERRLAE